MKPTKVLLLRHGETACEKGVLYSQCDVELSRRGLEQTKILVDGLKHLPISVIYSSDLLRARIGAEWLAQKTGAPLLITSKLREIDFGQWTGKRFSDLLKVPEFKIRLANPETITPPGGESLRDLQTRTLEVINEILKTFSEKLVVVFTHAGVIRSILLRALDTSLKNFFRIHQDFASVNLIDYYKDDPIIRLINGPFDINFSTLLFRESLI